MSRSVRFTLEDVSRLSPASQKEVQAQLYATPKTRAGQGIDSPKIVKRRATSQCGKAIKLGFMGSIPEYRFHPTRKWRFDYAWPKLKFAVEVDGGLFTNGRHSRGKAREADYIKDAEALMMGWRVLHVSTDQFRDGHAAVWIKTILDLIELDVL